jgi:hypothetical protein
MKIELEEPFKSLWKTGYLRKSDIDGRSRVDLFNDCKDRTTISYARYLVCVDIGYTLNSDYEVDHIDVDRTNDSLDNLQILSKEDHLRKTVTESSARKVIVDCHCKYCDKPFKREKRKIRGLNVFCSQVCSGSYYTKVETNCLIKADHQEYIPEIVELRNKGLSDYKISDILGINRSKVFRIRKLNNII